MFKTEEQPSTSVARRSWLALGLLCFPTAVLALDMSALYLAVSHIAASFGTTSVEELWILDIYPLMISGFLIPMGGLGDRWGNRRVLLAGSAAFAVFSTIASMAPSATILIVIRAVLGIAGASLMPTTLGLISELFQNAQHRRQAISIWTAAFMAGFALGPIIGGILLEYFGWGAIFLLAVPVIIPIIIIGPWLLPKTIKPIDQKDFDWLGSILFLTSILPLVYGFKELVSADNKLNGAVGIICGLFTGGIFIVRQINASTPLIDLKIMFSNSSLKAALTLLLLGPAIIGGLTLFVPQYLQLVYGLSATAAGTLIAPASIGLIIGALISPALAKKMKSSGTVIALGFLVMSLGLATIALGVHQGPTWVLVGFIVTYLGCGPFDALGTDIVISTAPKSKSASAGAAAETAVELGMGLGIALFGTLGTAVYQHIMISHIRHAAMNSTMVERATHSFSVAIVEASSLGGAEGAQLREQATAAFAAGFTLVASSTVVLALFLSLLSFAFLRETA